MLTPVEEIIEEIEKDRKSGASTLTDKALECFAVFAEQSSDKTLQTLQDQLLLICNELIHSQPDMAPMFTVTQRVLSCVENLKNQNPSPEKIRKTIKELIHTIRTELVQAKEKIAAIGLSLIKNSDTILTHSYSSSVKEMLISVHKMGTTFQVIATESRPGFEGRKLAQDLGREGIHTTLIVDSAACKLLQNASMVILGADRVTEKFFVNKIGSYSLALCTHHASKDVYVVCDTTKFVPTSFSTVESKLYPDEEVLEEELPNVTVENPYFEEVPLSFIKGVICEKGLLSPKEIGVII
ncbi:MAG: Methylthioribose-1-phosphate isomerase [Chlamydiae bacterium]|nr:Methylthioribose-1-phosphate isomerase [Chlamydiota bacterium]